MSPSARIFILVVLLTPPAVACYHRVQMDDPYITYRYARNLAEGRGFIYNEGERVLGTTAPLYAVLLSVPGRIAGNYPLISTLFSGAALGALGWLIGRILADFNESRAGFVAAFLVILNPYLGDVLGFELILFQALIFGAYAAYFSDRTSLAALLLALGTLTRGDGLAPAGLILGHHLWIHRREAWRPLLVFAVVVGAWSIYAAWTFGSPFPNTLEAKRAMGASGLWRSLWHGVFYTGGRYLESSPLFAWFALPALLGVGRMCRLDRRMLLIAGWPLLIFVGYWAMGVPAAYNYYAGLVPLLMILTALGTVSLAGRIADRLSGRRRRDGRITALLCVPLLVAVLTPTVNLLGREPQPRYPIYRSAGEWLAENTPAAASVGMVEIGIVGFYSHRYIVDVCGLVTPTVGPHIAAGDVAWPVRTYMPDFMLLHDPLWDSLEGPIASAPWFRKSYERVRTFDGPRPYRLAVYAKKQIGAD
ncbi:MAG: hypothetical protein OXU79_00580 [Gemmatimonadota bacterium]|nr:hypothetical protein [Gemmatimonadota bacterium]